MATGLLLLAGRLLAQADPAIRSPFMPPSSGVPAAKAVEAPSPFELHGVVFMPEGVRVSIFNGKSTAWVWLNESGRDFVVRSHRTVDTNEQVTIEHGGRSYDLVLKSPKVRSAAVIQPAAVRVAAPVPMPSGQLPVATSRPGPSPTLAPDQVRKLEEAIAEARRKREQRQSGGNVPQGTPGTRPANNQPAPRQR